MPWNKICHSICPPSLPQRRLRLVQVKYFSWLWIFSCSPPLFGLFIDFWAPFQSLSIMALILKASSTLLSVAKGLPGDEFIENEGFRTQTPPEEQQNKAVAWANIVLKRNLCLCPSHTAFSCFCYCFYPWNPLLRWILCQIKAWSSVQTTESSVFSRITKKSTFLKPNYSTRIHIFTKMKSQIKSWMLSQTSMSICTVQTRQILGRHAVSRSLSLSFSLRSLRVFLLSIVIHGESGMVRVPRTCVCVRMRTFIEKERRSLVEERRKVLNAPDPLGKKFGLCAQAAICLFLSDNDKTSELNELL